MARNEAYDSVTVTAGLLNDNVTTTSSDYTAQTDDIVLADASSNAITVTLPDPQTAVGVIVKVTDATNTVTIATPNNETIDGKATRTFSLAHQTAHIVSDGTDYYTIGLDSRTHIQSSEPTNASEGDVWFDTSN